MPLYDTNYLSSNRFQVSLSFLLQQAAWLYERHFAQMRAQMKKLGASNAPSPVPPQDATAFQRPSSQASRAPSALSIHNRDTVPAASIVSPVRAHGKSSRTILIRAEQSTAPPMSRTPSTNTVTQSRYPSSQHEHNRSFRSSLASQRRPSALDNIIAESRPSKLESSSSSGASSSLDERLTHPSLAKSQVFRRPPDLRAIASDGDGEEDDDDDDDSSSGFLPFASRDQHSATTDQTATLRRPTEQGLSGDTLPTRKASDMATPAKQKNVAPGSSRTTPGPAISNFASPESQKTVSSSPAPGALSPRRKAGLLREGSESSPSMGSSFSDLDGETNASCLLYNSNTVQTQALHNLPSRMRC